jgi:hypothetical protein
MPTTIEEVPSSIDNKCATDATAGLNSFFSALSADTEVQLQPDACYLVSNATSSELLIRNLRHITIDGNGATFEQRQFNYTGCAQPVQPVLSLIGNSDLTIDDITVEGPGSAGNSCYEGDYGIMVALANQNVTLDGVTIEDVEGDGLAVYPDLATNSGINTGITFENGQLTGIGYHAVTLEGVNGFTFQNNDVSDIGNFIDLEVDSSCGSRCYDASGNPVGAGQWNVLIQQNRFNNNRSYGTWFEASNDCDPEKNWTFIDNTLDTTTPLGGFLYGGANGACTNLSSTDSAGLVIDNNNSRALTSTDGSIAQPPGGPAIMIRSFNDVSIAGNSSYAFDGTSSYFPNTPYVPAVGLCSDNDVTISSNAFNNMWLPYVGSMGANGACAGGASNTNVTACNNTYWLTEPINGAAAEPKSDGACPAGAG